MESGSVTTPFGRRPMSLAILARQVSTRQIEPEKSVDKWKLYRALCEARPLLGITDRALALLNALLTFYPKNELSEAAGLIVFPSNTQLSLRAHGMPEQTIRRHLAVLIAAGLIIRKDSPNGKRYAHKDRIGTIEDAFGFSLAPLLARSEEIEGMAAEVIAKRMHLRRLKERLTLCRRDINKLVEAGLEEGVSANWHAIPGLLQEQLSRLSRIPTAAQLESVLEDLEALREHVLNQLENQPNIQNQRGNPYQNERHIQSSHSESISESEPRLETEQPTTSVHQLHRDIVPQPSSNLVVRALAQRKAINEAKVLKSFPLGIVLQACPQISDYARGGKIGHWSDLMLAAMVVRSMLGVSPSAYEEACAVMGAENAATVMACILEKAGHITSAGGYLRDLVRRSERGEFAIGPMLMALLRANGPLARPVNQAIDCAS